MSQITQIFLFRYIQKIIIYLCYPRFEDEKGELILTL